ncbi:MAG: hypothetical protein ABIS50_21600 [Luteolibacter sp.]|uniref:hypothetical protein n=1 Tax=Luteolibacter sp. TaxID=1962973 RepID=UPI003262D17F
MITGALILTALALALVFMIGEGLIHRKPKANPEIPAHIDLPPSPMEPAALAALEKFFEAPDLASKAAFVRDGERVRPMMEDYHNQRGHAFPTLGRVSPGRAASFDEVPMVLFEVEPFSGPRYPVAVVWDGHRFAVDWESLTAYGTIDWSEFLEMKPAAPQTLRVYAQDASETQQLPGTPDGFTCFRIEHRDDPQPLVAIASEEVAAMLKPLVENQRAPVTLEIAWKPIGPGGVPVPQILRLVGPKWSH